VSLAVVVTSSTSGIGRATAHAFAGEGATVVVHGLNEEGSDEVLAGVREAGGDPRFFPGDLRFAETCEGLINFAVAELGHIDVLVNNAGANFFLGALDADLAGWDDCLNLNLRAPWLCTKRAAPHMPRGSAIVNVASVHAFATVPNGFPYNVAKAGVVALTRVLALELAPAGIRVNAVSPGFVETPITGAWFRSLPDPEVERARMVSRHPVGRMGRPEDIARAIRFLALEAEASFVTGGRPRGSAGRSGLNGRTRALRATFTVELRRRSRAVRTWNTPSAVCYPVWPGLPTSR
jgi:NAD(P)-dependent dehydrogenase (short-subunit alcohol dehydrogenase family)